MNSTAAVHQSGASAWLTRAVGILAGRLARLLGQISGKEGDLAARSQAFLWASYETALQGLPPTFAPLIRRQADDEQQPIDRLMARFGLSDAAVELLLLAGMPEEHEGYSAVLRSLHPRGESRASVGLAAQLLFSDSGGRLALREELEHGPLIRCGIVQVSRDGPFFDRSLSVADCLWPALHDLNSWPLEAAPIEVAGHTDGLESWLSSDPAERALQALRQNENCTISVNGEDSLGAFHRAVALVNKSGRKPVAVAAPVPPTEDWQRLVSIHAALRDAVPVLRVSAASSPVTAEDPRVLFAAGPLVVAGSDAPGIFAIGRSLISLPMQSVGFLDRRRMWSALVPALADSADQLASRYPLEPFRVADSADDLRLIEALENRPPTPGDVAESLRSRVQRSLSAGVRLVRPNASWDDLVLPLDLLAQLHEAVDRLALQSCVLDDWGFRQNRSGARGVRMMFAGPPGTGKTISAEVLAHALDADLLVVDVSRVVSKWVGETEKNLAAVFDAAENSQAVLLFDEADSFFANRTEVSDAHDRYANLETAYLLQRLERFEGMAILATNLRQNIDAAFVRRLEFVLEFNEPDREQRIALWKRHIPAEAPLDPELQFQELAALYPVVGGVIRNATVAAAFRAAAEGMPLCREHFIHAVRREYEKAGKAFPGIPAGMRI